MPISEHFFLTWTFPGCRIIHYPRTSYTETVFEDGTKVPAAPEDTDEYRQTAQRLGYGSDTARMSLEHEFTHCWLALKRGYLHSPTLWALAHGEPAEEDAHRQEEAYILAFAAYVTGTGVAWEPQWREWAQEVTRELSY